MKFIKSDFWGWGLSVCALFHVGDALCWLRQGWLDQDRGVRADGPQQLGGQCRVLAVVEVKVEVEVEVEVEVVVVVVVGIWSHRHILFHKVTGDIG